MFKYDLYFLPEIGKLDNKELVGTFNSEQECHDEIIEHWKDRGIKIEYLREWVPKETDMIMVDFGSHLHGYAIDKRYNDCRGEDK